LTGATAEEDLMLVDVRQPDLVLPRLADILARSARPIESMGRGEMTDPGPDLE
jgi:hypothetical protein